MTLGPFTEAEVTELLAQHTTAAERLFVREAAQGAKRVRVVGC